MPIERAITETLKQAVKREPRRDLKDILNVPEEIKALPTEERVIEAGKFFEEDKAKEFVDVRQQDITNDTRATFAEQDKVQARKEAQQQQIDIAQQRIDEAPPILNAQTHAKLQTDKAFLTSQEEQLKVIQEKERQLYLKAMGLKKEKEQTNVFQSEINAGEGGYSTILRQISTTPGAGNKFQNIEGRTTAIYNRISSDMYELKEGMRTKWLGLSQDTQLADDVIRFLKDGQIKNTSRLKEVEKIATQWTNAANKIKALRNKAGARIGELEDWIIPQSHDARKMLKAGYAEWQKKILPKLDRERIEKEQGVSLEDVLESAYKNITTRDVATKSGKGGANLAKRGEFERVLHFKTGDDIISYKNEFGNPDTFSTMDSHIRQQSNEIAAMQLFGPNPEQTYNKLKELAKAKGMGDTKEALLDTRWRIVTGQVDGDNIIDKLDASIAAIGGTHRAIQVSSKLGSAAVSSLADLSSIILGSGYRGLSSINIMGKGLHTLLQEATTIGEVGMNIQIANRIGVVSEFASASLANSRYAEVGTGAAQKAAEVVIRASGLGSYTNSMRAAVGLEMAGNFAENFGRELKETPFARMFEEYGITPEEWNIIRKTETYNAKGAKFLDTKNIYEVDENLGYKVSEMISNEMDSFVITPTAGTRVWTTWGAKKGTIKGEAARNLMLFKSFPIASTLMHINRFKNIESVAGKTAYIASVIGINTVMGGITLWAYDIVSGNTPRSVYRAAMIPEALMKSGGLGIFGDFFMGAAETGYGHSFADTLLGVPVGTANDIINSAQDIITKDTDKAVGNIYKRAKSYIPGQNLWYTRAVVENTIGDFMGELIDPEHEKKKRRKMKALRLRGQEPLFKN
jgi:hypothetical protein